MIFHSNSTIFQVQPKCVGVSPNVTCTHNYDETNDGKDRNYEDIWRTKKRNGILVIPLVKIKLGMMGKAMVKVHHIIVER